MSAVIDGVQTVRFYRPDTHVRTPQMRSPEYVQLSTAAAITLGLVPGQMHRTACTLCLNLLVTYPEGCRANCAYCGLARHREAERDYADRNFIRVDWLTARYDEVIERVKSGGDKGQFERMCRSMITHPNSNADTYTLLDKWTRGSAGAGVHPPRTRRPWSATTSCACATWAQRSSPSRSTP
jgi:biotin synthase